MTHALLSPRAAQDFIAANPHTVVLDATIGVPDVHAGYNLRHIPGARVFDVEGIADHLSPYPHTLPSAEDFAAAVGALGVTNDTPVLVYDQKGISFAAARAWWMFRVFGHDNVRVINGGLPAWMMAGLPIESGPQATTTPATFRSHYRPELYRSYEEVERVSETGDEVIVDARPPMRFEAMGRTIDGDPIPTHIPTSVNLPFTNLLDPNGAMKTDTEISKILERYQPRDQKNLIVTCGSGITACVLALGFYQTGLKNTSVFDGSWTEWSGRQQIR